MRRGFHTSRMYLGIGVLFNFILFEKMDQRNCIQFGVKNEIKPAKTFEMLTGAFGESIMSRTQVELWYNQFKAESMSMTMFVRALQQPKRTLKQ